MRAGDRTGRRRGRIRSAFRALGAWHRLRLTSAGTIFLAGALAVGLAAINTGNNLLYLLLGAMLGAAVVSAWISEQTLREVEISRRIPHGVPVGQEASLRYRVRNRKRRLSVLGLVIREQGLPGAAFIPRIGAEQTVEARSVNTFVRRGVYPLATLTLSTTFPFGFFRRERDVDLGGELVIWPRTDRAVAPPRAGATPRNALGATTAHAAGPRGEFRGLREYRRGDDARDIHWRSSARRTTPVVREYDRDASDTLHVCLDIASEPGEAAEHAVEIAASLAARASAAGRRHGLIAGDTIVSPSTGRAHLERILEVLARVDFRVDAAPPAPNVGPSACVLVGSRSRAGAWADVRLAAPR